jgi:hypothetical protein
MRCNFHDLSKCAEFNERDSRGVSERCSETAAYIPDAGIRFNLALHECLNGCGAQEYIRSRTMVLRKILGEVREPFANVWLSIYRTFCGLHRFAPVPK